MHTKLVTALIAGSLLAAQPAAALDPIGSDCGRQDRCLALPPTIEGPLSDHGGFYDPQGNPVDRWGNVIAVPSSAVRAGDSPRAIREVFVSDTRPLR